eukprot:6290911-Amphidinium_carterae.1
MRGLIVLATYVNRLAGMLPAAGQWLKVYSSHTRASLYYKPPPRNSLEVNTYNSLSFPQDVASSAQSLKPRKIVGTWPQLLRRPCKKRGCSIELEERT